MHEMKGAYHGGAFVVVLCGEIHLSSQRVRGTAVESRRDDQQLGAEGD